jgi:hypothetical protein
MTPPDTLSHDAAYVLRRPASFDVHASENRKAPDLTDELLELREALEKEIAERDREVAERRARPAETDADVFPAIDMASRIRSAMRAAFGQFRLSNDVRRR